MSGPYLSWADRGRCPYLYHNVRRDLVSPPLGMRSSVPLGGKSSILKWWCIVCPPSNNAKLILFHLPSLAKFYHANFHPQLMIISLLFLFNDRHIYWLH